MRCSDPYSFWWINSFFQAQNRYICDSDGGVTCLAGWKEKEYNPDPLKPCSVPVCNPDCGDHGECVQPDTCACQIGWWEHTILWSITNVKLSQGRFWKGHEYEYVHQNHSNYTWQPLGFNLKLGSLHCGSGLAWFSPDLRHSLPGSPTLEPFISGGSFSSHPLLVME